MDTASELNLSEVYRILWRRRAVFFILFSAVFLTVLLVSFLTPPTYRASAKLIIQREGSLFPVGIIPNVSDKGFYNTQKEMVSSTLILDKALQKAKDKRLVEDTGLGELKGGVSSGYLNSSNILETKVDLKNEKEAVILANSINSVFIDYHINTKTRLVDKSLEILSRETASLKRDIEVIEGRLKEFRDKEQMGFYQAQISHYVGRIVELQKKNKLTEASIKRLQMEFYKTNRLLKGKGKDKKSLNPLIPRVFGQVSGEGPTSSIAQNAWIQDLKIKLADMEVQLSTLLVEYTNEHPGVQGVRRKIASLKRGLDRELKGVLATHANYYEGYIRFLESQKKTVEAEKRRYRSGLDKISEDIDKAALRYIEFTTLSKNYDIKQSIYATFLQKQRALELLREEVSNPAISNIRVFEQASLPLGKVSPNIPLNLFLGAFFGVFIGISGGLVLETKEKKVQAAPLVESRFSGTERRSMSRLGIPLNVTYKLVGDAAQMEYAAASEDISGTGIKIRVDKYISKGAQLDLEIHLNLNDSIKATAEVMWMIPSEEKDMFQGGLHFVKIDSGEREKLINYLYGEHYLTEVAT